MHFVAEIMNYALITMNNLFYSTEKVFEESTFHRYTIDIFYMFFWTLVTQVMLGWVYYPIQIIPEFGGLELKQIPGEIL